MKKLLLVLSCCFTAALYGQTYSTGWDNTADQSDWTEIRKGDASLYQWLYDNFEFVSSSYSLAHYYPVGGSIPTDDWFVSPVFDFSDGGMVDTLWKNFSGFGTPNPGDTIGLYLLNGSTDPDLANKAVLYMFTDSVYNNDNVWRKDSLIPVPAVSGDSYLAFRYRTVVNWLDVKFDNLSVTENALLSISQVFDTPMILQSNYVHDKLVLSSSGSSPIGLESTIYAVNGMLVKKGVIDGSEIDISDLENGLYILTINSDQGLLRQKFLKY
ncbi:MAG: T9SS type A sorting domain-containing protein [Crocinitomicaceae bacterium]